MSESERENGRPEGQEEAAEAEAAQAKQPSAPPEVALEDRLAQAQAEAARVRDQLLRTAADFDNFRKRSRREVDDAQRRGRETILKDLLPVFDILELAVTHAAAAPDVRSVAEGLRMVLKQFADTLDRMGIKRIPAVGTTFDPNVHEAIQQLESTEHPAGVVMAEVKPGYAFGDNLIRAATVVVSKGPPAGSPPSEAS
ncbi:MAG: nucleotide exchange factor GrpE [Polyangiaceae bacterium]|nr:nucleotide exchange factor GrpE [Polyangiaceae bacterium]